MLFRSTTDDNVSSEIRQQSIDEMLEGLREQRGLIAVNRSMLKEEFIEDVKNDKKMLEQIYEDWYGTRSKAPKELDPKLDRLEAKLAKMLKQDPNRKIVVFSSYADTVNYLYEGLIKRGVKRILKYTSSDAGREMKKKVRSNFDAGISQNEQNNDYDVLIATDALSEGFNLHRAGVVINYDIPYNPTRVIRSEERR